MPSNQLYPNPYMPEPVLYRGTTYFVPPPMHTVDRPRLRFFQNVERHPVEAFRPEPGETGIVVDTSYFRWWIAGPVYATTGPRIYVNGTEVPTASWGPTYIPVAPGLHRVEVLTRGVNLLVRFLVRAWDSDMGPAETVVPVEPGCRTTVYYRSPAFYLLPGAMGPKPPRWPGLNWIRTSWVVFGALFALMFTAVVLNILG
ncbi:hypothetical protein IU427_27565 [Nocardia beijingensis]|uniref:hypothetical protein n=1 Tax=Nocardia beijingensis TaxID=95162 RepID=UPI00189381D4|nr:hypothetical protein [Nocardia beijingensis]MBF6468894.1 hypothetical protein [Nocardia beijingensis]